MRMKLGRKDSRPLQNPLSDLEHIEFWSDKNLKAGDWKAQLEAAMEGAIACVLLVSDNFLASDFIRTVELPYLLEAHEKRSLMILWAYLEPCDIRRFPSITRFQAMTLGNLKSMAEMSQWEWKQTMLKGYHMIFSRTWRHRSLTRRSSASACRGFATKER